MANTSEIPAENEANTTPTGQNGKGAAKGRRIVKAATPKPGDGANGGAFTFLGPSTPNGLKNSNDDEDFVPISGSKKKNDLDDQEAWRMERLKATEKRGKALREKELQARRQANAVNKEADASGNPFSRFLSVFSVEPKHPEHKRSLEDAPDETEGPSEKRLKPSDPDAGTGGESGGGGKEPFSLFSFKAFWVTTALAVAVGVALAVHRGRKK